MTLDELWLPTGRHWGLVIEKRPLPDAGSFTTGDGNRMVWHTTEGYGIELMWQVLKGKNAAPHFIIDPSAGDSRVYQCIALNRAARALQNDQGDLHQTNRAGDHTIQVEIVDYARNASNWGDEFYRDLAALTVLIEHRVPIPRQAKPFLHPKQMTDAQFEMFRGHCGHVHVPDNDHWDPGKLNWPKLLRAIEQVDARYT